jgi:DNA-binding NarL/FixJ family response regulator
MSATDDAATVDAMPAARRLRIVHCDDASSFRTLVRYWLEDYPAFEIVGGASDAHAAVTIAHTLRPDVIVTDTFGAAADPTLVRSLRVAAPGAMLIVLTGYLEEQLHPEIARIADRVVTKAYNEARLVEVLDGALIDKN